MQIILARHGRTAWNSERRFHGQQDVPLDDIGREQAAQIANYLRNFKISAVYSSDLKRATETAKIISDKVHADITTTTYLRERKGGEFEGMTLAAIRKLRKERKDKDLFDPGYQPQGGESLIQVFRRVKRLFRKIVSSHDREDTILFVAHSSVIRMMLGYALGVHPYKAAFRFGTVNGSVTILDHANGRYHMRKFNHTSHMVGTTHHINVRRRKQPGKRRGGGGQKPTHRRNEGRLETSSEAGKGGGEGNTRRKRRRPQRRSAPTGGHAKPRTTPIKRQETAAKNTAAHHEPRSVQKRQQNPPVPKGSRKTRRRDPREERTTSKMGEGEQKRGSTKSEKRQQGGQKPSRTPPRTHDDGRRNSQQKSQQSVDGVQGSSSPKRDRYSTNDNSRRNSSISDGQRHGRKNDRRKNDTARRDTKAR